MYNEIEIIDKIPQRKDRAKVLLIFIEEYSGWVQHLKSVGLVWGADGEEVGANKELVKAKTHLSTLKQKLVDLVN